MASFLINFKYLSKEHLLGFDKYKYKSIDTSPLSNYVMHPFWDQLVKVVPLWVPANLLTLTGWLFSLLSFILLSYYDTHFSSSSDINNQTVPQWVWLLSAFCIFAAHQLDGIDGKQARRTNSGSPLGELFDHGLDSSTVVFMCLGILSLFGLGERTAMHWEIVFLYAMVLLAFWIAHWEKYNTSVMFLPWAYDISQIWLTGSYLYTYFYDIGVWKEDVFQSFNIPDIFKMLFYFLVVVLLIPMSFYNQIRARIYTPSDCKGVIEGLVPVFCISLVSILYFVFGYYSPANIVITDLRLYLVGYGLLYTNINCRLIVAQMSGELCDRFNFIALPLIPMIILSKFQLVSDYNLLVSFVIFASFAHLHYGVNVVRQLCDHLNIYCFRVAKPKALKTNGHSYSNGIKKD